MHEKRGKNVDNCRVIIGEGWPFRTPGCGASWGPNWGLLRPFDGTEGFEGEGVLILNPLIYAMLCSILDTIGIFFL